MLRVEPDVKLDFSDVLLKPMRSDLGSRSEVNLERDMYFPHSKRAWRGVPIIVSNMDTTGTIEMALVLQKHKMITCLHKSYTKEQLMPSLSNLNRDYFMLSTGIINVDPPTLPTAVCNDKCNALTPEQCTCFHHPELCACKTPSDALAPSEWSTFVDLVETVKPHFLCIDVANGYSTKFVEFGKKVRERFPDITLVGGNVTTGDMTQELSLYCKFDIIKCGIGSGSVCTTRLQTGVGYPQLSAISECAFTSHGCHTHIISDGGIQHVGDFSKAFCAGADFVMSGSMFSGHDECKGEVIKDEESGRKYKLFYGMSSATAMNKYAGGVASYRSAEGKVVKVPHKGPVEATIQNILGGIRSTMTYIGAHNIKDMPKCALFIRVNNQVNTIYNTRENQV